MSGPQCDCYVLAPNRSAILTMAFLNRFLPERSPLWDPDDPAEVVGVSARATEAEILQFLESQPSQSYAMYWSNRQSGPPSTAILAFNRDGSVLLGLSCEEDEHLASTLLRELEAFSGTGQGYWGVEEAPVVSKAEFVQRLLTSNR